MKSTTQAQSADSDVSRKTSIRVSRQHDRFADKSRTRNGNRRPKRLEEIEDPIASDRTNRFVPRFSIVLAALTVLCLLMAIIVWWRLLT